jgi:hypothetical protein
VCLKGRVVQFPEALGYLIIDRLDKVCRSALVGILLRPLARLAEGGVCGWVGPVVLRCIIGHEP